MLWQIKKIWSYLEVRIILNIIYKHWSQFSIFSIDLWNNGNLVQDIFLGEIKVPVNVLRNDSSHQAW